MTQEKTPSDFEIAALNAEKVLQEIFNSLSEEEMKGALAVCRWHTENYMKAGHKRLGRILVEFEKRLQSQPNPGTPENEG